MAPVSVVCGYADRGISKIAARATERHTWCNTVVIVIASSLLRLKNARTRKLTWPEHSTRVRAMQIVLCGAKSSLSHLFVAVHRDAQGRIGPRRQDLALAGVVAGQLADGGPFGIDEAAFLHIAQPDRRGGRRCWGKRNAHATSDPAHEELVGAVRGGVR